ncbi:DUF2225 domain-containing protein [Paenibacillus tarimensis]
MKPEISKMIERLMNRNPLQGLSPEKLWDEAMDEQIGAMFGQSEQDPNKLAVQSALHLWNDSLNRSHDLSQHITDSTGSYLHGLMHRMEGDYSNAKYWFRQAGYHPAMPNIHREAVDMIAGELNAGFGSNGRAEELLTDIAREERWNPYLMVDAVMSQESGGGSPEARQLLERLQRLEMVQIIRCIEANL